MKKQNKQGISLIVLVITIIVMIILAAAIIVSLTNNNIIGKSKDAVDQTNLKQVQELAQTLWADAYIDGARTQKDLEDAVLEGLKGTDTSKYDITVTTNGVDVSLKGENSNPDTGTETEPEEETVKELVGAVITPVEGSSVENIKAGNPMVGDTVEYNGYIYKFGQMCGFTGADWSNVSDVKNSNAWGVRVKDTTLATYSDMENNIYGKPVGFLGFTYMDCTTMVSAPKLSTEAEVVMGTFRNCSQLKNVTLPEKVTNLIMAFTNCTAMTTAPLIPEGVTNMMGTFFGCSALTTVQNIPSSVTELQEAFSKCTSLTTIPDLPSSITKLISTFSGCTSMTTTPLIPEGVTDLSSTFSSCTSLTTVQNIPSNVIDLGSTFQNCSALASAPAIPATVTDLHLTFRNCTSLTGTITINATNLTTYEECFSGTTKSIVLAKTACPVLNEIAATATNNNVTVEQ